MNTRNRWPKQDVKHDDIVFDTYNPRLPLEQIGMLNQEKLYNFLIESGADRIAYQMRIDGFHNSEILIVVKEGSKFVVVDGNRRLAAFRYACKKEWVDGIITLLPITIAPSREEADQEIVTKHVGNLKSNWNSLNQLNKLQEIVSRSKVSLVEISRQHPALGKEKGIKRRLKNLAIYNIITRQPWLTEKEKNILKQRGINMINRFFTSKSSNVFFDWDAMDYPFDELELERKINDPASKRIIKRYILNRNTSAQIKASEVEKIYQSTTSSSESDKQGRKVSTQKKTTERTVLVPNDCTITIIKQGRIKNIYLELKNDLRVDKTPNAAAVLFRVFIELSLDHYLEKKMRYIPGRNENISGKITKVTNYMEKEEIANKNQLNNIRGVGSGNTYLSIENFHAYVHSTRTSPTPEDIKLKWDNLQEFFEMLWDDVS